MPLVSISHIHFTLWFDLLWGLLWGSLLCLHFFSTDIHFQGDIILFQGFKYPLCTDNSKICISSRTSHMNSIFIQPTAPSRSTWMSKQHLRLNRPPAGLLVSFTSLTCFSSSLVHHSTWQLYLSSCSSLNLLFSSSLISTQLAHLVSSTFKLNAESERLLTTMLFC